MTRAPRCAAGELCASRFGAYIRLGTTLVRAVSVYRSKFSDCPAGAVPNSYPELDLLWDNVIAGQGMAPLYGASASPGPSPRSAAGRDDWSIMTGRLSEDSIRPVFT